MATPEKFNPDLEATLASPVGTRTPSSDSSALTAAGFGAPVPLLEPGTVLAGRYELLVVLGQGGMGAVYKAQDRELDRVVALKTIRPEMAASPEMLARFKQEVLLASQITHPNIIRLYDLGEAAGMKFITMEFIEGEDLRSVLLSKGKLTAAESVDIIRQVCLALQAAHAKGVIHRDLKPQNVMLAQDGRVVVMDFGLARSLAYAGMTQTGAMMGTMEYMSPEQAMAGELDQRSDIFAVGLIFFELMTGQMPYKAESALASLLKRSQERAIPVSEIDGSIPQPLSNVVSRCLERDRENRYPNIEELLADLEAYKTSGTTSAKVLARPRVQAGSVYKWPALVAMAVAIFVGSFFAWKKLSTPALVNHAPVSVLVADFSNYTGDPVFDDTLEPMFNVALEGASFINAYNRGTARKLAEKLPHPTDKLDEQSARLVAVSQEVSAVVIGSLSRRGDGYKLSVEALDARTGNTLGHAETSVASKDDVVLAVPKLAAPIRQALGDTTPESVQLAAAGGAFTTASVEAVHQYSVGMEDQFAGNFAGSVDAFSKAVELDPNFARAYAGMAGQAANLGKLQDAQKYIKLAMEHVDRMTERERYRIRGLFYGNTGDWQKCVEEYTELLKRYPVDNIGHNNLANCYSHLHNLPKAVDEVRRAVELNPNSITWRANFSLFSSYAGDFHAGEQQAREIQRRNPSFEYGYLALAFAQLGEGQVSQATETYEKLEKLSPQGASMAASGLADIAMYEGRLEDAVKILDRGAAADLAAKNADAAADKFAALANAQLGMQHNQAAVAAAEKALANSQAFKTRFLAAQVFVQAGETAKAQKLASSLAAEIQGEPQAYGKIIPGMIDLKRGDARAAIKEFSDANTLLDTWIGHFELGRAYVDAGAFAEADSEFDTCIRRRGEALALFLDEAPTFAYLPPVYYYQGRDREGLKSPGFADSYHTYLAIRGKSTEDPLLADIHRRLAQ